MKPRVFIGSSTEGLHVAYALQYNLDNDAEITVWPQDVFRPSKYILDSLINQLDKTDMGIFVFSASDVVRMRGIEKAAVRDNVIFEFGLWVGQLGQDRSIIVAPKDEELHLPSDLLGVNYLTYTNNRADENWNAALGPASNQLRTLLHNVEQRAESLLPELSLSYGERRDNLSDKQRDILAIIAKQDSITMREILAEFPNIGPAEMTYRLEYLRFQLFILRDSVESEADYNEHVYRTTIAYRKFYNRKFNKTLLSKKQFE